MLLDYTQAQRSRPRANFSPFLRSEVARFGALFFFLFRSARQPGPMRATQASPPPLDHRSPTGRANLPSPPPSTSSDLDPVASQVRRVPTRFKLLPKY
jgi:heme/copper-type cytochrome/quinol oxidase subunit 3